jgi:hypothetical protein
MEKNLQECKEIVAKESGWESWKGLILNESLSNILIVHDLANKMYYEQSELAQLRAENERLKEQIKLQKVNYLHLSNQLHKITNP